MTEQTINRQHATRIERISQWRKIRDAIEGEDRVKAAGQAYLPRPGGMDNAKYAAYKQRANFYGVADRTLMGLTGLMFRNEPQITLPSRLTAWYEMASPDGASLEMVVQEVSSEVLAMGRMGLLLDFPEETLSPVTPPLISKYYTEDILDWRVGFNKMGVVSLMRLVLRQDLDPSDTEDPECLLEYLLTDDRGVVCVKWTRTSKGGRDKNTGRFASAGRYIASEPKQILVAGKPIDKIPFVFINTKNIRPEVQKPPFLDLVNVNMAHYRNSADYEHSLFLTAQPTPYAKGSFSEGAAPRTIGPGVIWILPPDGGAGMVEFTGAGISAMKDAMKDKEERMAALGARLISEPKKAAETAQTTRMKANGDTSLLVSTATSVEVGVNALITIASTWLGQPVSMQDDIIPLKMSKDFIEARMEPGEMKELVATWIAGAISRQTLHENLQRGEIIAGDIDLDTELDRIKEDIEEMGEEEDPEVDAEEEDEPPEEEDTTGTE